MTTEKPDADEAKSREVGDVRGKGFAQILHDRSRAAGERLDSLILSLSTAVLGIAFFALTTDIRPPLTKIQKATLLLALPAFSISVLSGIVALRADVYRNLYHALALQRREQRKTQERDAMYRKRDWWLRVERATGRSQEIGFVVGIIVLLIYVACRVMAY